MDTRYEHNAQEDFTALYLLSCASPTRITPLTQSSTREEDVRHAVADNERIRVHVSRETCDVTLLRHAYTESIPPHPVPSHTSSFHARCEYSPLPIHHPPSRVMVALVHKKPSAYPNTDPDAYTDMPHMHTSRLPRNHGRNAPRGRMTSSSAIVTPRKGAEVSRETFRVQPLSRARQEVSLASRTLSAPPSHLVENTTPSIHIIRHPEKHHTSDE